VRTSAPLCDFSTASSLVAKERKLMERHPEGKRLKMRLTSQLAGEPGFEPGLHGPEPCVLPLDDSPASVILLVPFYQSIFRILVSRFLVIILAAFYQNATGSVPPKNRTGIGQLIQSQLPNPLPNHRCLACLCNQSLAQLLLKYQLTLLSQSLYRLATVLSGPLYGEVRLELSWPNAAGGAGELSPRTALLLPQYVVEVML
jgi:hypothetical protein